MAWGRHCSVLQEEETAISTWARARSCAIYCFRTRENKACNLNSAPCSAQGNRRAWNSRRTLGIARQPSAQRQKEEVQSSPVPRTAASARAARAPSRGPSRPAPWTGTLEQTDPRRNSRFSPARVSPVLHKWNSCNKSEPLCSKRNAAETSYDLSSHWKRLRFNRWLLNCHETLDEILCSLSYSGGSLALCSSKSISFTRCIDQKAFSLGNKNTLTPSITAHSCLLFWSLILIEKCWFTCQLQIRPFQICLSEYSTKNTQVLHSESEKTAGMGEFSSRYIRDEDSGVTEWQHITCAEESSPTVEKQDWGSGDPDSLFWYRSLGWYWANFKIAIIYSARMIRGRNERVTLDWRI